MNLKDIQENLKKTGFDSEKQEGILTLIDTKINNDMKEVIMEIKNLSVKTDSEMKRIEDKIDTKTNMILWVMGILIALIVALKFIS